MKKFFFGFAALQLLTACGVMTFKNNLPANGPTYDRWHHNVVQGLIEISPAVDLNVQCQGNWASVTTQQTFINAVASSAVASALQATAGVGVSLWNPQTVSTVCSK